MAKLVIGETRATVWEACDSGDLIMCDGITWLISDSGFWVNFANGDSRDSDYFEERNLINVTENSLLTVEL